MTEIPEPTDETDELWAVKEDPNGLASLIVGEFLDLHRRTAEDYERVTALNRAATAVLADLGRQALSSSTATALRAAGVSLNRLDATIQQEIRAGRWSLAASGPHRSRSAELVRGFDEVATEWRMSVAAANDSLEKAILRTHTALDGYEHHARRMCPGADSHLAPFAFPQPTYIGDKLAADSAYSHKERVFPRWLMRVDVVPDRTWAALPRIDLCDRNLVFLPDGPSLSYTDASAAVRGIVADQMSRAAPNRLKITWIDAAHNGQGAGAFLRLAEREPRIIDGQVWTEPDGIEAALVRVVKRMAALERFCLTDDLPHLDAYNSRYGDAPEAHQVVVVAGYPLGFRESSARLLKQITDNGNRVGVSVIVVMDTSMASILRLTPSTAPTYATLSVGTVPVDAPAWWSPAVLPSGDLVLGHAGRSYAPVATIPRQESVWVPCELEPPTVAVQNAIISGYLRASTQLAASGLSPRELHAQQLDPVARTVSLRLAMLRWLHEEEQASQSPADWSGFFGAGSRRDGIRYTDAEVAKQASYLKEQGYTGAGAFPCLTSKGEDMAMKKNPGVDDFAENSSKFGGEKVIKNIYGPSFGGDMSGAQIAFDNHTVTQIRQKTGQPAPGFEELADAVQQILIQLPQLGLTAEHSEDVTESAKEILTEVGTPSPDRGRIRRGLAALRGLLQPVATQAVLGAGEGAHDLAKAALEHLAPF